MKSLSQKGWVESIHGRPSLIKPIAVDTLLPRIRRQLSEGLERKLTLIRELGSHMGEASEAISALVYYGEAQLPQKPPKSYLTTEMSGCARCIMGAEA